jgi:site-specific recombinase XerD
MSAHRFKITPFVNPSGAKAYRVSGTLDGKSIRKNFKSRSDAVAFRQDLEIKFLNQESEGQTVWTTLTHDQNREAIAAINMLKRSGSTKPLTFAVNYFLQHYKEAAESMSIEAATEEYTESKAKECKREILSARQERAIRIEMDKLKGFFAGRIVGEIRADELREYLDMPLGRSKAVPTLKTWNNRRGYLSTFFKFCLSKKYVAEDPILEVPKFKVKKARGTADTLSAEEAKDFMHWLETYKGPQNKDGTFWGKPGCMVPYYALTLFAGIRPDWKDGEIKKLQAKDFRFETDVILIEPEVSKVNEKRTIKIQPNLRKWLEKYPLTEFPIIPERRFRDLWADVRKERKLTHDVMRHTFISMTVGAFRSVGDASLQAGNSEAVIRKHYLDLKSVEEADVFWGIVPAGDALPAMEKKDGRYVAKKKKKAK